MLPILDYAKESYEDMKHDVRQEGAVQARQEEVVVVRVFVLMMMLPRSVSGTGTSPWSLPDR